MKRKIIGFVFTVIFLIIGTFVLTACSEEMLKEYKLIVHYELNGGEWLEGDEEIADKVISYNENQSVHFTNQQPIKAGYVFAGWDLDLNLKETKANIVAVWLDIDVDGITDQNGEPITAKNAGLDKDTGLPTVIPKKESEYIDENGNGRQDKDEPTIEFEFKGWGRIIAQADDMHPVVQPIWNRVIYATVYFDFNGGFPSTIVNGINPTNLETSDIWEENTYEHYYQKKKIALSLYNGTMYKGVVQDDKDANASIDSVSIPVKNNHIFIGWSPVEHNSPNQVVILYPYQTHEFYYDISTHTYSWANARNEEKLIYYAQWKQTKPEGIKLRVGFDFNEGIPTTDGATLTTSNQTWNCNGNQHYYEIKPVVGSFIAGTLYSVSVSDDINANALVDNVSIPSRNNYIFKGWALQHDGAVVLYYPSDIYTYTYDTNNSSANLLVFYAQWEKKDSPQTEKFKYVIHYIEDINDANTGDYNYYTNNPDTISFEFNPLAGVFNEQTVGTGDSILAPNTTPTSVSLNGTIYIFDYWTLNPNAPSNFFNGTVTTADLTNATIVAPNVKLAKLYAVYKAKDYITPDNVTKGTIYFIEDIVDFNTGDNSYYADIMHQQYSTDISDGYFYKVTGIFGQNLINSTPIIAPNPYPNGGVHLGNEYEFSYWTLDPTITNPIDFFDTYPNATFNDVFNNTQYTNETAFLYAVYKTKTTSQVVYKKPKDISNNTTAEKLTFENGNYIVAIICNGYDQGNGTTPAGQVAITIRDSQGSIITQVSPCPLRALTYGQYYYSDVFTLSAGDYITLEYSVSSTAGGDTGSNIISIIKIS